MALLALIALALFAASSDASRIVDGWPTTVERYPSMVQLELRPLFSTNWFHSCGGSILTPRYVLSAAHCFSGISYYDRTRRIRAGTSILSTGGVIVMVERTINHPSFDSMINFDADISLVRLVSALEFSPVIQPASIMAQGTPLPDGLPVQNLGWGLTTENGSPSEELLETSIYTINRELCAARYLTLDPPQIVTETMICTGLLDVGGRGFCHGDSGGPLYYTDPNLGEILVGVISWFAGCANTTFPDVNTAVSSYTQWIVDTAI